MKIQMHRRREAARLIFLSKLSHRKIAKIIGSSHTFIDKFAKKLVDSGMTWEQYKAMDDKQFSAVLRPLSETVNKKVTPGWSEAREKLAQFKYLTLEVLWEEYQKAFTDRAYSYSQYTFLYREYVKGVDPSMRLRHIAGEKVFVDYAGTTIRWRNPEENGRIEKAQIFIATLGCSNYTFVWASRSQGIEDWIEAHIQMFEFFGGVPEILVPDNLKSAVIKAGKEPSLNRAYQELSQHYDCLVYPARVREPQDKAKAEKGVLDFTRWITARLIDRTFFSIGEINQAILELLPLLNERPLQKMPGCRHSRFDDTDKPALRPLPKSPFEYAAWMTRQKAAKDYHVFVQKHAYSVPYQLIGQYVEAQLSLNIVELFHNGQRVASHQRSREEGGFTVDKTHMPAQHFAYAQQDLASFMEWAESIGVSTLEVVISQFKGRHECSAIAASACNKLKSLARLHGHEEFEAACERAVLIGSITVKSIKSILRTQLFKLDRPDLENQPQLPLHENVRGAEYFKGDL